MIEPKSQVKKCSAHAEILQQNDERTVYRLKETDGEVRITAYPVFPGIELAYHDVHAPSYRLAEPGAAGLIEIQHCREGRAEYCCGGEHYFLAPGDLSVVRRAAIEGEVEFPTGHYHGITVTLDPALAPDCLSCILQDVDVRPSVLAEKFFADSECFVSRSSARVEHIFSELYAVPAGIRRGYFKVKVLELLLFLSALDEIEDGRGEDLPRHHHAQHGEGVEKDGFEHGAAHGRGSDAPETEVQRGGDRRAEQERDENAGNLAEQSREISGQKDGLAPHGERVEAVRRAALRQVREGEHRKEKAEEEGNEDAAAHAGIEQQTGRIRCAVAALIGGKL